MYTKNSLIVSVCNVHMSLSSSDTVHMSGNVVCSWGRVEDGQLGHGDTDDRLLPTKLSALDGQDIICVTCGADHTMARSESGRDVYSWGWYYALHLNYLLAIRDVIKMVNLDLEPQRTLFCHKKFKNLSWYVPVFGHGNWLNTNIQGIPIKMVAAGAEHSVAITEDGNLYGWGWGRYGNLGLDGRKYVILNLLVLTSNIILTENLQGDKMAMVACGWRHTRCVSSSGGLYTTGWGKYGQLGHGNFEDHLVPRKVQALSDKFISQAFSVDGSSGQHIESSKPYPTSGKSLSSISKRYAIAPDETPIARTNTHKAEQNNKERIWSREVEVAHGSGGVEVDGREVCAVTRLIGAVCAVTRLIGAACAVMGLVGAVLAPEEVVQAVTRRRGDGMLIVMAVRW
ncbi:hypothetical protein JHK82_020037 [Glycine max]|nr:hypothetical protein JHK85_020490 [Glycine max]KAG5024147.1 hypothetical protein JHK86_020061 [Glycine max]KAG5135306.1 hypothetical protein JHK82_020037 [Glycine max]KHN16940.1 Putative E3 ubiquitin-protein ligase HERC4 [Glycine soja]